MYKRKQYICMKNYKKIKKRQMSSAYDTVTYI